MYFPANSAFPDHLQSVIFSSTTKLLEKLLLPPKLPRKVAKNNAGSQPREMDVAWEKHLEIMWQATKLETL